MVDEKDSPQLDADKESHLPPSREKMLTLPGEEPRLRRLADLTIKESLAVAAYRRVNRSPTFAEIIKKLDLTKATNWLVSVYRSEDDEFPEEHAYDRFALDAKVSFATSIGERIRAIRQYLQMDQNEFATLLDVKQGTISKWENDKSTPPDDILEKLASVCDSPHPSFLRYGPREYTSAGELVPELPVLIIGELTPHGTITMFPTSETRATERPREGRPYKDVVAIEVGSDLPGTWMGIDQFFYRFTLHLDPEECVGLLCVMKVRDLPNLWVGHIHKRIGHHYIVLSATNILIDTDTADMVIEWASPVLAMRQIVPFLHPFGDGDGPIPD